MAKHHITFYVSLKKSEKITFSDYEFAVYLFLQFPKDIYLVLNFLRHPFGCPPFDFRFATARSHPHYIKRSFYFKSHR